MKWAHSLRLRVTLWCALLLTLCCTALAVTSNLSAIQLADSITAVPLYPAQTAPGLDAEMPLTLVSPPAPAVQQARQLFHIQSLLATAAILAAGLLLIYLLVGRALAPLKELSIQIQNRTAQDLAQPLPIPNGGDEIAELARSFNEMSRRLDRAFVMQRSFSQNAAHEFRTPMAVLKTRIGLFRKKQDFSPQTTEEFLRILEDEVDRLSGMVDSLLKLTSLEQVPRTDRIELSELLHQVTEDVSSLFSGKGMHISTEAAPGSIQGSRELLRRALFNLVENAVKYAIVTGDDGHGSVTVSADEASAGTRITVTVKPDSGYVLDELTITDAKNKDLKVTKRSETTYTFYMADSKVTVDASFIGDGAAEKPDARFDDVSANAYYADAVEWAVSKGITSGTSANTFSPDASCTRAQMVTFLWRANGSPKADRANPFTDVSAEAYYYDAVLWAVEQGITSGTSATTFSPDATVNRGQTVTFLWRANGSPVVDYAMSFTDVDANAYYAGAVRWAVSEGITSGTSGNSFSPNADCTRAQIVTFLYQDMAN